MIFETDQPVQEGVEDDAKDGPLLVDEPDADDGERETMDEVGRPIWQIELDAAILSRMTTKPTDWVNAERWFVRKHGKGA